MPAIANILSIAGSDSGGGAGIQADIKTISALGGFAMTVITALTAQNGLGVDGIHAPDAAFAALQLATVRKGFPVHAAKTGMLFSAPIITAIADNLQDKDFPLVVDPVCVSQSGHRLLEESAVEAMKDTILPLADLLTPNLPEAELLADMKIPNESAIPDAMERLLALGPKAVLLKGGHVQGATKATDWLAVPGKTPEALTLPWLETPHTHGTGCTLSAAIATGLGQELSLRDAVQRARRYLHACLERGYAPGEGFGPPYHMAVCNCREI